MQKNRQMSERKNRKLNTEIKIANVEFESDENFAFIVGYTSGGASYGVTHEEMNELEKENHEADNKEKQISSREAL
jgi:methyl coenzyme M reductase gamma subunit